MTNKRDTNLLPLLLFILLLFINLLAGCGPSSGDNPAPSTTTVPVYGLNFGPYLDGQDPNLHTPISESQLTKRMAIIAPYTNWVRTFGMSDGLERSGAIAHKLNLKVALGAWLSANTTANDTQINNLITALDNGDADMAIVGSEVLLRGDLSEDALIAYIQQVRSRSGGVPVAYADAYNVWLSHPAVIAAVDVVLVNYYPYWEGIHVDQAIGAIHNWHQQMESASLGKPVIVSETGWPSDGNILGNAVPSPDNAAIFFMNFVSWAEANKVNYFYFEGFDETWKALYEGPQGAHWGVWDKNGVMKPEMQPVFDGKRLADNWSNPGIPGGPGDPSIAFTFVPPIGSFENLRGQVLHVAPGEYKVALYIYVSGWWTKPYFSNPITTIAPDGSFVTDITTGGIDQTATMVAAFLVANDYTPPLISGDSTLPQTLFDNAAANLEVVR